MKFTSEMVESVVRQRKQPDSVGEDTYKALVRLHDEMLDAGSDVILGGIIVEEGSVSFDPRGLAGKIYIAMSAKL